MSEVPVWAWVVAASVGGPLAMKVLDALFARVVRKEDERAAHVDAKLEALASGLAAMKDYIRDRFDELNGRRESDLRELTERLHVIERELPDKLRKAKHDAVNDMAPRVGYCEAKCNELESRLARLEGGRP